jgi:acyl-CoA synthetase (AMP-forming)/AMP-acid ligase II
MLGLMQQKNLLLPSIIQHAARWHPDANIVSRTSETNLHRSDYATIERRSRRLANVLQRFGVKQGDRVATMAWNGYRQAEQTGVAPTISDLSDR